MGNLIAGTTIQGRTFEEIAIQKSKEGVPRPIVFGTARPIVGNVIASSDPTIVISREDAGGKGGGVEVENEEVYRTYAIRICEGPVDGVRRIWRNNELVYFSESTDPIQLENNAAFLESATIYLGGFDQMPSPVLEAVFGVGSVPAHRGTCYMVVDNQNLSDNGGAIPQYAFEVVRSEGFYLTSRPYTVEVVEAVGSSFESIDESPSYSLLESVDSSFFSISGELIGTVFHSYDEYDPEAIDSAFLSLGGDLIPTVFHSYDEYYPEAIDSSFLGPVTGYLKVVLVSYNNYEIEAIDSQFLSISGVLT